MYRFGAIQLSELVICLKLVIFHILEICFEGSQASKLRPKFFDFVIFSLFWSFGRKKQSPTKKNFTREENFDFEIFVLKYVSKHSETIPTKKVFTTKIF